jgi:hypothetical protein
MEIRRVSTIELTQNLSSILDEVRVCRRFRVAGTSVPGWLCTGLPELDLVLHTGYGLLSYS